jgi:hypothetical protein
VGSRAGSRVAGASSRAWLILPDDCGQLSVLAGGLGSGSRRCCRLVSLLAAAGLAVVTAFRCCGSWLLIGGRICLARAWLIP